MKNKLNLILIILSIIISSTSFGQAVQKNYMNYQGVARDASGDLLSNENITIGIALKFGSNTVTNSYAENHNITTDANGVFSLEIGNGTPTMGDYNTLEWNGIAPFVSTSINGSEIGTTELLAVPYALYAGNVQWFADGNNIENANSGTVYVNNNLEVGANIKLQLGPAANEISTDGTLSGDSDKAIPTEKAVKTYVDNASVNIEINDLADAKVDSDGYSMFLGKDAGKSDTGFDDEGLESRNLGVGLESLYLNSTGTYNTAIGHVSLYSNETGTYNTASGYSSLSRNTIGGSNTAFGAVALWQNTSGTDNTAVGTAALRENIEGDGNSAFGKRALFGNTGYYNSAVGLNALIGNTTGNYNTSMGNYALKNSITGSYNAAFGNDALSNLTDGSNNIGLGADSRVPNPTGSHQVRIGNTQISYAGIQVAWTITSDIRWKESVGELPYGIDFVNRLKPVDYIRKNNESKTREAGFIAQDVEELLKELGVENSGMLTKGNDDALELRYNDFIPILTKAIQEQQATIDALKLQNSEIAVELEAIRFMLKK